MTPATRAPNGGAHIRPQRCLRWPEVKKLVGVSRTTWWRMIKRGEAPAAHRLSANCVGWWEADITAFQATLGAQAPDVGEAV